MKQNQDLIPLSENIQVSQHTGILYHKVRVAEAIEHKLQSKKSMSQ